MSLADTPVKDPVAFWHAEHADFTRLLDLLQTQVDSFREGQQPDYDLMLDIVTYLRHFPDRFHHPREDVAFDCLARLDPRLKMTVNRLKQEHRVIAASGDDLLEKIREVTLEVVMTRATLEAAAAMYLVYFRHHLAFEEEEVLPAAARLLTAKDWAAVEAAAPQVPDPLFGQDTDAGYRELRRRLVREAREA